jgi:hypothetical protein
MTGIRILQGRVKHLNEVSKRRFLLSSLGTTLTSRLMSPDGKGNLILNDLSAKGSLMIIESLIDFFLTDRENNPLLYAF